MPDTAAAPQPPAMAPAAPDPAEAPEAEGGYTICLKVTADGQMSVSVDVDGPDESDEAGAPEPDGDETAQPVPNIQAAMKLIKQIVSHAGQMADAGADESDMSSGYGKAGM